ncbi:MAG: diguanylate cyclase [Acidobacteria bacterium]|nr:diguanylate cyclase [Acidobacteriota bacterium]
MSLRGRLTLFFVLIVVVPLAVAGLAASSIVSREVDRRTKSHLDLAARVAATVHGERVSRAVREVRQIAPEVAHATGPGRLQPLLDESRRLAELDFVVVATPSGSLVAGSEGTGTFLRAALTPSLSQIAARAAPPTVTRASVTLVLPGGRKLMVYGGWFVDRRYLAGLAEASGAEILLVTGGSIVASSGPSPPAIPRRPSGAFALPGGLRGLAVGEPDGRSSLVVVVPRDGNPAAMRAAVILIVLASLLIATALGSALARLVARPLQRLTAGALAIARGDLEQRVEIRGSDDVATLAAAFNTMTENLRRHIGEMRDSRDELRRVLERLGATLGSTQDLDTMLQVVLESAAVTLRASAGAVYRATGPGRLSAPTTWSAEREGPPPPRGAAVEFGDGLAGAVAASMIPARVPSREREALCPRTPEPSCETAVAAPLARGEQLVGVLALYGRNEDFTEDDLATLTSFARQASVAIENVMLREESRQESITDPLTGIWNRRYLQAALTTEVERARRYGRPLSVIMIDIDRFKDVNDAHGHQRGDGVLVELCRRVGDRVRARVDTLARYGGEEFVVVLPETPLAGAVSVARKLLAAVRSEPFAGQAGEPALRITLSAGVAEFPSDASTGEALLRAADEALYRAKRGGRDRLEAPARATAGAAR